MQRKTYVYGAKLDLINDSSYRKPAKYLLLPLGSDIRQHWIPAEEGDDANHEEVTQGGEHVEVKPEQAEQSKDNWKMLP